MGKPYSGGVALPTPFKVLQNEPISDEFIVEYISDLNDERYTGDFKFVLEDDTFYIKKSTGWEPTFSIGNSQSKNEVLNITSLELVSNTLTLGANSNWKIQDVAYTNPADFWLNIPNAATGQKRKDRVLLDQDNKIVLLQGAEHPTKAFLKPYNENLFIEISQTDVNGASINVQAAELNAYVKKNEAGFNLLSYNNAVEFININEKCGYVFGGTQEVVNYIADYTYNSPLYDGQERFFYNNQDNPITFKHNYGTGLALARKFSFKGNRDFVLQPKTGFNAKWVASLGFWILVASQNGANYSTDEILTGGTWIDGKPIYRKVLTLADSWEIVGTSNYNLYEIDGYGTEIDEITNVRFNSTNQYGETIRSDSYNGNATLPQKIKINNYGDGSYYIGLFMTISNSIPFTATSLALIIEYTKTTD